MTTVTINKKMKVLSIVALNFVLCTMVVVLAGAFSVWYWYFKTTSDVLYLLAVQLLFMYPCVIFMYACFGERAKKYMRRKLRRVRK